MGFSIGFFRRKEARLCRAEGKSHRAKKRVIAARETSLCLSSGKLPFLTHTLHYTQPLTRGRRDQRGPSPSSLTLMVSRDSRRKDEDDMQNASGGRRRNSPCASKKRVEGKDSTAFSFKSDL